MTDQEAERPTAADEADEEELYGLSDEEVRRVREALEAGRHREIEAIAEELHAADLADLIERSGRRGAPRWSSASSATFSIPRSSPISTRPSARR